MVTCKCGKNWKSINYHHCSVCHMTFGTVALFDDHKNDDCCDPTQMNLIEVDQVWHISGTIN